jgi:hypothetical protein
VKRLLVALGVLVVSAPLWAQEIIVFKDFRSLSVQGHRVQGDWTYLRLAGGELAVLSDRILEIRQEGSDSRGGSAPPPVPTRPPEPPRAQTPPAPPPVPPPPMPIRPRQPGAMNQPPPDEDDDEGDDSAADGDEDDEEPPAPAPAPPQSPIKPARVPPTAGAIGKPASATAQPHNFDR